MDAYIKNGEWFLKDITSYSESISYDCCPEKYPFVMFEIHIRRRTLYFVFNLIFPCILISLMSLLGFLLPPDSSEKIGLGIINLLRIFLEFKLAHLILIYRGCCFTFNYNVFPNNKPNYTGIIIVCFKNW